MTEEYTPTEAQVRAHYGAAAYTGEGQDRRLAEFDRFMAEVRREAWDEGKRHESECLSTWGQFCPHDDCNPYTKESTP